MQLFHIDNLLEDFEGSLWLERRLRYAVRIKSTSTEMAPTYHFVTSLIYTSTDPFQKGTATVCDPNSRKRKIANILYRCY